MQPSSVIRQKWLDEHVPLRYLHHLREDVIAGRDPRPPPIPLSSLASFFAAYTEFHARQLLHPTNETRYLVHKTQPYYHMGMGNRLLGVISSFLYAALTDRVLLLDWEHSNDNFNLTDVFAHPPIDWRAAPVLDQRITSSNDNPADPFLWIDGWSDRVRASKEHVLCNQPIPDWPAGKEPQYLWVRTNQYFAPMVFHNLRFKDRLEAAGFISGRLAPPVLRFLVNPSANIRERVVNFTTSYFAPYTIGIQLRSRDGHTTSDEITRLMYRCAHVLTQHIPPSWHSSHQVAWFIAADQSSLVDFGRSLYQNATQRWPYPPRLLHLPCPMDFESREAIECSMVTMFLLAEVDDLVMSKMSTFGDIAHSLSLLEPMSATQELTCVRQPSVDPCHHRWHDVRQLSCFSPNLVEIEDINGFCRGAQRVPE